ncbi:MAG: class I SAM-dependent methyltransferase [Nitrososphaerales archaeon]
MKITESDMPDEDSWKIFFDPYKILITLGLNNKITDVAEFGCGYGTFTIPAAKMIGGTVYAIDIEPKMVEITQKKAKESRLNNVKTMLRDFISEGSGLEEESVSYVMLFNILHSDKAKKLIEETYRILRPGGKVGILHWNYDPSTPRGPPINIRLKPAQCVGLAISSGFKNPQLYDLTPYHYGIVSTKG